MHIDVLDRSASEPYRELFQQCPNAFAQQSVEWSDVVSPLSPDVPYFLVARESSGSEALGGMPIYLYECEMGRILNSVPHAGPLGGVFCRDELDSPTREKVYTALVEQALQIAKEKQCLSMSLISNPFIDDDPLYEKLNPSFIFQNFNQAIALPKILDEHDEYQTGKSKYNSHLRKNLKRAKEYETEVAWENGTDFSDWYDIHLKRHEELNAPPLPKKLLQAILTFMKPTGIGDLAVAKYQGRVIGGCFYIWHKNIVDYFILSSDSKFFDYRVNYRLVDYGIRIFREKGMQMFNWQSSKPDSSVYDFKKRWGSRKFSYSLITWIGEGFSRLFEWNLADIRKNFQWHYVAPFAALQDKALSGTYRK